MTRNNPRHDVKSNPWMTVHHVIDVCTRNDQQMSDIEITSYRCKLKGRNGGGGFHQHICTLIQQHFDDEVPYRSFSLHPASYVYIGMSLLTQHLRREKYHIAPNRCCVKSDIPIYT